MMEPAEYIAEAVADAEKRSPRILTSPSMLNDADWERIVRIVRTKGPLQGIDAINFHYEHDTTAKRHFLDLVFECERLYEIVRLMGEKRVQVDGDSACV